VKTSAKKPLKNSRKPSFVATRRPFLTVQECADILRVHPMWFYRGAAEKNGLKVLRIGSQLRIDQDDLDTYLREGSN
jgi:excisionase family DNA binding protein